MLTKEEYLFRFKETNTQHFLNCPIPQLNKTLALRISWAAIESSKFTRPFLTQTGIHLFFFVPIWPLLVAWTPWMTSYKSSTNAIRLPARENSGVIGVLQNITFINIYSIAKLNVLKIQSFPLTLVFASIHGTSLSTRAEWDIS